MYASVDLDLHHIAVMLCTNSNVNIRVLNPKLDELCIMHSGVHLVRRQDLINFVHSQGESAQPDHFSSPLLPANVAACIDTMLFLMKMMKYEVYCVPLNVTPYHNALFAMQSY